MKKIVSNRATVKIFGAFLLFFLLLTCLPAMKVEAGWESYEESLNASTDPWEILSGRSGSSGYGIVSIGGDNFAVSIYRLLKNTIVIVCVIATMMSLISIPFISNSAALKEKKEELTHKALIFALSFAVIPLLNFAKAVLDYQFGL